MPSSLVHTKNSSGEKSHEASYPWGKLSIGEMSLGELSMERVVYEASCQWGECCLCDEMSMG
jgi:hypothetical protein